MKNQRALAVMAAAIVCGLIAVLLAWRWLMHQQSGATSGSRVVVAASDMTLGQRIAPEMLKVVEWPAGSMPKGAFSDPQKLAGRVLKTSLLAGEPINEAKLAPVGSVGGLAAVITEGKRAITVRVNDVVGVAGFALPGTYVDIIVSTEKVTPAGGNRRDQSISKIVLERILVLAVAQEVGRDETKPKVVNAVTLEVTPEQAEQLDLARSVGTLSLALRNQVDPAPVDTRGATKLSLLPQAEPKVVKAAKTAPTVQKVALPVKQQNCVRVINGLHATKECF